MIGEKSSYGRLLDAERDFRIGGMRIAFVSHRMETDGGKVIITVRRVVYTIHVMQC